jgi:hypothetical protein
MSSLTTLDEPCLVDGDGIAQSDCAQPAAKKSKADKNRVKNKRRREAVKAAKLALKTTTTPTISVVPPVVDTRSRYERDGELTRAENQGLKAGLSRLRDTLVAFTPESRRLAIGLERMSRLDSDKLAARIHTHRGGYVAISECKRLGYQQLRTLAKNVGDQIVACKLVRKSKDVRAAQLASNAYEAAIRDFVVGCFQAEGLDSMARQYAAANSVRKRGADAKRAAAMADAQARKALVKAMASSMKLSQRK